MKTAPTYATKVQLFDYVTKREFKDFTEEFYDFRSSTEARFVSIEARFVSVDKRFNSIDRRMDDLKEDFRIHTGAILDQSKANMETILEYIKDRLPLKPVTL